MLHPGMRGAHRHWGGGGQRGVNALCRAAAKTQKRVLRGGGTCPRGLGGPLGPVTSEEGCPWGLWAGEPRLGARGAAGAWGVSSRLCLDLSSHTPGSSAPQPFLGGLGLPRPASLQLPPQCPRLHHTCLAGEPGSARGVKGRVKGEACL